MEFQGQEAEFFEDGLCTKISDKLDAKNQDGVHSAFPFSSSEIEAYKVPNWTKNLLYHSLELEDVH